MSTFRCKQCEENTTDPIAHLFEQHDRSGNLRDVWEQFLLVGSSDSRRRLGTKREEIVTEPLWV